MHRVPSRRIGINGHQTGIRLEPEFWYWLRLIAAECGTTATNLIEGIVVAKNPNRSLSSALRVLLPATFTTRRRATDWLTPKPVRFPTREAEKVPQAKGNAARRFD